MYKRFYFNILFFLITGFVLVGIFNLIIDPYGLFRGYEKVGVNQQKEGMRSKIRYVKAIQVGAENPKTIIFGSSRVHDGINPNSKFIPQDFMPVYNYGIPMVRIKELKLFLLHSIQNHNVKNIVIGLDFFMFNSKEKLNHEFDPNILSDKYKLLNYYIKPLLTSTAFIDSIKTIQLSHAQKMRNEFLKNGYRPGSQVNFGVKNYEKLHNYTNWTFLSSRQTGTLYYQDFGLDDEVFSDFKEIIDICAINKITLVLYISPAHANLDGEGIAMSHNLKFFEIWKRKITTLSSNAGITLWDFSGYNSVTTEMVRTPMEYFWDPSHFTEKIGDLILERIFSPDLKKDEIDSYLDFGIKLTPQNIEWQLEQTRLNRLRYMQNNVIAIEKLHFMYTRALNGDKEDLSDVEGIF